MAAGLDVGTSYIVLSKDNSGNVTYKDFRDAFYVIKPTTPVATKMIEKGLSGKVFIKDSDGAFILLGKDAIEKAIERNDTAKRPMYKGVVSAKEKDAKRVLAFILKEVAGQASEPNEKLVFCVPAQPVDQEDEDFDVGYHEDVVKTILGECGYAARAINEAEALCYAELEDTDYTGIAVSCGAGMTNVCVMLNGEPTVVFSTTKSGDWIE
jgi:actin-like ATPase involved in cell morphogenesis